MRGLLRRLTWKGLQRPAQRTMAAAGSKPRVAVGQLNSTGDHAANLAQAEKLCEDAAAAGANLLCLPEAFSFIGASPQETISQAEALDGPRLEQYRALARRHGLWLSLGGLHEAGAPGNRVHNTHVVVDAKGDTVAEYRKIHLFDVDVPGGATLLESKSTAPGKAEAVVVDARDELGFTFGLTTCYDVRFPELYVALARRGCDAILVPSAFTVPTGEAHWHLLLRARAVESQSYILAAAQAGAHNEKRRSYGHALAVDPWGVVVADAGDAAPSLVTVDLDLEKVRSIREKMPIQAHRRRDVVELLLDDG
jgi:predicted amidohydrolase